MAIKRHLHWHRFCEYCGEDQLNDRNGVAWMRWCNCEGGPPGPPAPPTKLNDEERVYFLRVVPGILGTERRIR